MRVNNLGSIFNPQTMALNLLQKKNPQMANMIRDYMQKGVDPNVILKQEIERGNLNMNQLNQIKSMSNQLGINISQDTFNQAESLINNKQQQQRPIEANTNNVNNSNHKFRF